MSNIYGRQVVEALVNKSGGGVIKGDTVVIDTSNNGAFTTSTAGAYTGMVGIAQETIASNATGRVLTAGYADLVNTSASVTRGNFGKTHTVAKQTVDAGSSRVAGAFCQFLTGGTTPTAHVFGIADNTSGAGTGTVTTVEEVDGSPTDSAVTKIVFPNGTLGIASHVATYTPAAGFIGTLTEATLSGDVTMTNADQFYDGPTITPAAGVYEVWGRILLQAQGANRVFTGRLIANASATPIDEGEQSVTVSTHVGSLVLAARVTADGTNPILIRAASANASDKFLRDPVIDSSSVHRATLLRIIRVS